MGFKGKAHLLSPRRHRLEPAQETGIIWRATSVLLQQDAPTHIPVHVVSLRRTCDPMRDSHSLQ